MGAQDFLTPGNMINGGILLAMWATLWYQRARHSGEDRREETDELREKLNTHLIECADSQARMETKLDNLKDNVDEVKRKLSNVQSQLRNVATGTHDTKFTVAKEGQHD